MDGQFTLAVVGTGFASTFFLREFLKHAPSDARVVVLERGRKTDYTQPKNLRRKDVSFDDMIVNKTPDKPWIANIGFGGGTCWTGNTPRMLPNDFRTGSLYGVGTDWPMSYDELEPCYVEVEEAMLIAGAPGGPYPRSKAYPLKAHRMNALDRAFFEKYGEAYLPMPSARASEAAGGRPPCCGNGVCSTCPITAKFQIDLHMKQVFADPRVTLLLDSSVDRVEVEGDVAKGVHFRAGGKTDFVRADLVAVGAHAVMTPWILLNSGLTDHALGRYLNEQIGLDVLVYLKGLQNYDGSQATTGLGTMFMDGPFRSKRAGCLVENWNLPWLRAEAGRWREKGFLKLVFEDLPQADSRVTLSKDEPDKPEVTYSRYSDYMKAGMAAADSILAELFAELPVESYEIRPLEGLETDAHIQGTVRMGTDPASSVVDRHLRHHRVRNLLALGSGVFPTCPTANPTLTLSALSVWSARSLFA